MLKAMRVIHSSHLAVCHAGRGRQPLDSPRSCVRNARDWSCHYRYKDNLTRTRSKRRHTPASLSAPLRRWRPRQLFQRLVESPATDTGRACAGTGECGPSTHQLVLVSIKFMHQMQGGIARPGTHYNKRRKTGQHAMNCLLFILKAGVERTCRGPRRQLEGRRRRRAVCRRRPRLPVQLRPLDGLPQQGAGRRCRDIHRAQRLSDRRPQTVWLRARWAVHAAALRSECCFLTCTRLRSRVCICRRVVRSTMPVARIGCSCRSFNRARL